MTKATKKQEEALERQREKEIGIEPEIMKGLMSEQQFPL